MVHVAAKAVDSSSACCEMLVLAERHTKKTHVQLRHHITIQSSVENICVHILIQYTLKSCPSKYESTKLQV